MARACTEIFEAINKRRRINNIEAEVSISYVEVFGDRISDLLRNGERCGQSKAAGHQYVLQGLNLTVHSGVMAINSGTI